MYLHILFSYSFFSPRASSSLSHIIKMVLNTKVPELNQPTYISACKIFTIQYSACQDVHMKNTVLSKGHLSLSGQMFCQRTAECLFISSFLASSSPFIYQVLLKDEGSFPFSLAIIKLLSLHYVIMLQRYECASFQKVFIKYKGSNALCKWMGELQI